MAVDLPVAWARCHGNRCLFASWSSRGGPTRRKSSPTSAPLEPWTWRLLKCAVSATRVRLCTVPARLPPHLQLARGVSPSLPCLHLANANFCRRLCVFCHAGFASAISSTARQASTLAKPRTIRACHRASSSRLARVIWHEKKMRDCTVVTTGNKSERRSVKPGCAENKAPVCLAQGHPVSGDVNAAAAAT